MKRVHEVVHRQYFFLFAQSQSIHIKMKGFCSSIYFFLKVKPNTLKDKLFLNYQLQLAGYHIKCMTGPLNISQNSRKQFKIHVWIVYAKTGASGGSLVLGFSPGLSLPHKVHPLYSYSLVQLTTNILILVYEVHLVIFLVLHPVALLGDRLL